MIEETTYQETYKFLQEHGWEKITPAQYTLEKTKRKNATARIGFFGFFKLKKSQSAITQNKILRKKSK